MSDLGEAKEGGRDDSWDGPMKPIVPKMPLRNRKVSAAPRGDNGFMRLQHTPKHVLRGRPVEQSAGSTADMIGTNLPQ